ncbi:alpha/beta fold hydrolase [Hoeflea sp. CAU 1731]
MASKSVKIEFDGHSGARLAARLDTPDGEVRAYALFAHCFTCTKDFVAARRIAAELARLGIAVLRFDFTGLGASGGEFASTNFSTNIADLRSAVDFLRENYQAPSLLIGHSLGGAAMLAVAGDTPEARAVATIGAPADAAHVLKNFGADLAEIEKRGEAQVTLGGRRFVIQKQFVEDAREVEISRRIAAMKKPLLILHSPLDNIVGIDNATKIFTAAKHPKSFVSLDHADHLISKEEDAAFVATMISAWASRYLPEDAPQGLEEIEAVRVSETGEGKFQNTVHAGKHRLFADEPESVGGMDSGPSPYDYLSAALGACTSMTLRMYADHKKLDLGRIIVDVSHKKMHAKDCEDCTLQQRENGGKIDRFERVISIEPDIPASLHDKMIEIAGKCPVHRTLESTSHIATRVKKDTE